MSPQQLGTSVRKARKPYRCGMCASRIKVGDHYRVSSNVYDGRVYDWRECLPCDRDGIVAEVYYWAGHPDEGVDADSAVDWATDAVRWSRRGSERRVARNWLARVAGGEGE